ncbi:MAG: hypothetical protein M1830_007032, partial [Pleopsidium flavum]
SLLTLRASDVPTSVQQGWPRLLQGAVRLFQTLPAALKHREEATKEDDLALGEDYEDGDDDEEEEEWEADTEWNNDGEEAEGDVKDESSAYLEFLNEEVCEEEISMLSVSSHTSQAQKFGTVSDDDDDELEEESLLETPLDQVEPYGLFKDTLMKLQQEQPQLYESLTKILNPEEQQIVQSVVHQAEANAMATVAAADKVNGDSQ